MPHGPIVHFFKVLMSAWSTKVALVPAFMSQEKLLKMLSGWCAWEGSVAVVLQEKQDYYNVHVYSIDHCMAFNLCNRK